jgi:hypothetical protein
MQSGVTRVEREGGGKSIGSRDCLGHDLGFSFEFSKFSCPGLRAESPPRLIGPLLQTPNKPDFFL